MLDYIVFPKERERASVVLSHHCQLTAPGAPWDSCWESETEGRRKMRIVYLDLVVGAGEGDDGGGWERWQLESSSDTRGAHALLTASDTAMQRRSGGTSRLGGSVDEVGDTLQVQAHTNISNLQCKMTIIKQCPTDMIERDIRDAWTNPQVIFTCLEEERKEPAGELYREF